MKAGYFTHLDDFPVTTKRDFHAVNPISPADAQGRWHWRLYELKGVAFLAEQVRPDGLVAREKRIVKRAGSTSVTTFDSYGTLVSTLEAFDDGRERVTLRSGLSNGGCSYTRVTEVSPTQFESRCFLENNAPSPFPDGCFRWRSTLSEAGLLIARECLLPQGDALDPRMPVTRHVHDGPWLVEKRFVDASGKPWRHPRGERCFGYRYAYDLTGAVTSSTCLDGQGGPMNVPGVAASTRYFLHDGRGCQTETFVASEQHRAASIHGAWSEKRETNDHCDATFSEHFERPGQLAGGIDGIAVHRYGYDEHGDLIQQSCFDIERKPTSCNVASWGQGATVRWEHDERGRVTAERHYNRDGSASGSKGSTAYHIETLYSKNGRRSVLRFYGVDDRPTTVLGDVGQIGFSYDVFGRQVRSSYFDWSGEPVTSEQGYHASRDSFDDQGRLVRVELLSRSGDPASISEPGGHRIWVEGASRVEVLQSEIVHNLLFDAKGKLLKEIVCDSDKVFCFR